MNDPNGVTLRQMQDAKPVAVSQNEKPAPAEAPVYEVLARSYIGGRVVEAGERVKYGGKPGAYLKHVSGTPWKEPAAAPAAKEKKNAPASAETPPVDPATDSSGQSGTF